ncbi:MAG: nicotinate (nicotinamide) nucleotide adenylyltransferase [Ignavibacteriota bacterium]
MRLAIFGGTFDPIHEAHLAIAREAIEHSRLDRVLLVPADNPPHKSGVTNAPYADRVRMAEIASRGLGHLEVSRLEEGTRWSYSIDTIEKVRAGMAAEDELFFVIGADAFADIRTWRRWQDVARAVCFLVVSRPGAMYEGAARSADRAARPAGAGDFLLGNSPRTGGRQAPRRDAGRGDGLHRGARIVWDWDCGAGFIVTTITVPPRSGIVSLSKARSGQC